MNGDINADIDEEGYDNVIAILSRCQSAQLKNICQLVCSVAMSELVCWSTHALQAIMRDYWQLTLNYGDALLLDISRLYSRSNPNECLSVWQLISPVNEIMTRQEEKVFDFLRRFVLSLNSRMLVRFISGSSYAGANIKVDFKAGFTRRPLANTCSSHSSLYIL